MLGRIKEQPAVGKLIAQYDQLPRRDQKALLVLSIAIFIGILYFVIWRPVADFNDRAVSARENAVELLGWMQANRSNIAALAATGSNGGSPSSIANGRELMAVVTRSAGEAGISLQRFEPSGDTAIRVWLENVPFNQVAAWLEGLGDEHGIVVDQASLDRRDTPGLVSVRLTLAI